MPYSAWITTLHDRKDIQLPLTLKGGGTKLANPGASGSVVIINNKHHTCLTNIQILPGL